MPLAGAVSNQELGDIVEAPLHAEIQRCPAVLVRRVRIRTIYQKQIDNSALSIACRIKEGTVA